MKGRGKDCSSGGKRYRTVNMIVVFVILILLVGVTKLSLTEAKAKKAQKTNSEEIQVENKGCESMELNPLRTEEYPEITSAVDAYYESLGEKASFVDSYDNVKVYTKLGKYRDTYVAFARYDMKIKDIYTKVPGLGTVYVRKGQDGQYQVSADVEDGEVKSYIEGIVQHEDVKALMNETQSAYQAAVQSDALLKEALMDLKNAYEDSTGS